MSKTGGSSAEIERRLIGVMRYLKLRTKGEFAAWAGRSNAAVSDWFSGKTPVPLEIALKLKRNKNISLDWLYDGDDSGQTPTITSALEAPDEPTPPQIVKISTKKRRAAA